METIWSSGNRISWCLPVSGTVAHRVRNRIDPMMNVMCKIVLFINWIIERLYLEG